MPTPDGMCRQIRLDRQARHSLDSSVHRPRSSWRLDISALHDGLQLSIGRLRDVCIFSAGVSESLP